MQEQPSEEPPKPKHTSEGLPIVTQETIDSFPFFTGRNVPEEEAMAALDQMARDNPELSHKIMARVEELAERCGSRYASGFLTGAFNAYELLRRQGEAYIMEEMFEQKP